MGSIVARSSRLHGVDVPAAAVPGLIDEIPALAVAAAHAQGRFTVSGAAELRVKESDRIAALAEGLRRMGATVEERPDGLAIDGGHPSAVPRCAPTTTTGSPWPWPWPGSPHRGARGSKAPKPPRSRSPSSTTCWPPGPALGESAPERVVLVGFMGSGKSTVGRILARRLGWGFVDMDERIEERAGRRIADIFREQGEAAFRQEELRSPASSNRPSAE